MPSLTAGIKPKSERSNRILKAVNDRMQSSRRAYSQRHLNWRQNEEEALAYLPESELKRIQQLERESSGRPTLTELKIPYSYGVLMASHSYWTTVFLSRNPILQYTGRHGETAQQVQALEALMDYQVQVGEMIVPLYLWLLDAGKYGLGVLANYWVDEFSVISSIEETPELFAGLIDTGRKKKQKINRRVPGYSGNKLNNVRPYDFFPDPRVPVRFFQKGEFCGVRVEIGWNQILKRMDQGYYVEEAIQYLRNKYGPTAGGEGEFGYRIEGSSQIQLPERDAYYVESSVGSNKSPRNATLGCFECTIELVPNEWGLGRGNYPEKWVFTTLDDYSVVLGAQPLGANHDKFPFAVLEYEPEGYAIASRGIGEILKPINDTMDWLVNSHLYNVRKALNDQFVVDPSQVELSDLENPLPGGAIRLAPGAYGGDTRTALTQLAVNDVTRTHLTDMSAMLNIGQRTIGTNDQIMGLTNQTGRRSATEIRTGAGFGVNRLKTVSEFFSAMGFAPISSMMVQNAQQYYDGDKKFKIVGQLAAEAGNEFIEVNPETIGGFYDFVPVDGTQPVDRLAQAQLWQQIFGQIVKIPPLLERYDIGRIFEWVAQLAGLKNISQFRIVLTPEEQLLQQAQQGNVIPLRPGGGGAPSAAGNAPQPGAISGGTTPSGPGSNTGPNPPIQTTAGGPRIQA